MNWLDFVAGGLQVAAAAYALRLNHLFGARRVGWWLFGAFVAQALLCLAQSPGTGLAIPVRAGVFYVVIALLLLIAMAQIEGLQRKRLLLEAEQQLARCQLEQSVRAKTADLVRVNEDLRQEIARRHEQEQALKASEEQLRQAQKMEAIGQLAGGVAHDFNNLLTVMQGYLDLLLAGQHDATTKQHLNQVLAAAQRAASLTRQLLAFGRRHTIRLEPVNLNAIIGNLAKMLSRVIGEDITLRNQLEPHLEPVCADAGMMEQVIMNLVVNARDAMPKGGTLTMATRLCDIAAAHARLHQDARAGSFVCLSVCDTGCGMAPEVVSHLFEPFFTTKDVGKGTGLGLATVYGIIRQHSGWVEVTSAVGRGSEFRVYLPCARTAAPKVPGEPAPAKELGGKQTVLLVEDEEAVRNLAGVILTGHGYKVIEADCGATALELWQKRAGEIDVVVTDMVMPGGISGRDLAERLRQSRPGLGVVFTSGYSPSRAGQDKQLLKGLRFLPKPYNAETLLSAIRQELVVNISS